MQRTTIGHFFILSRTADLIAAEGVEHFGITARVFISRYTFFLLARAVS
jgi:hypothetical protein